MEPVTIAIICGVFGTLAAFIRLLVSSRDKRLNKLAQQRALAQEARKLEKMRTQISRNKRFDSHYQVLGDNKYAIHYLDQKIEEILKKKAELIQRYVKITLNDASAIVARSQTPEHKAVYYKLKEEIDSEVTSYDKEILQLQNRRVNLWDSHLELQEYLLEQEKRCSTHWDTTYQQQSNMLEKIYLRHHEDNEQVDKFSIEAATLTFKEMIKAPMTFLLGVFKLSSGILPDVAAKEAKARQELAEAEADINNDVSVEFVMQLDSHTDKKEKLPDGYRRALEKIEI